MFGNTNVCLNCSTFNAESYDFLKFKILPFLKFLKSVQQRIRFIPGYIQTIKGYLLIYDKYFKNQLLNTFNAANFDTNNQRIFINL